MRWAAAGAADGEALPARRVTRADVANTEPAYPNVGRRPRHGSGGMFSN
jgi:hypothetical protein